jgi:drug/metabolite transporter (DMT)-like permease
MSADRVDAVTLSAMRFGLGGVLLFGMGLALHGRRMVVRDVRTLGQLSVLALFGIAGMSALLFLSTRYTTAGNSALIQQLNPLLMIPAGALVGVRVRALDLVGAVVGLAGCLIVVGVVTPQGFCFEGDHLKGDLMALLSAACWVVYTIMGKPMVARVGVFPATAWVMVLGAAELALIGWLLPIRIIWPADGTTYGMVVYLALFPTAIGFFAWYEALDRIDLSLLSVMQYLTAVSTLALGWALLDERLTLFRCAGVALVLGGVALTSYRPSAAAAPDAGPAS